MNHLHILRCFTMVKIGRWCYLKAFFFAFGGGCFHSSEIYCNFHNLPITTNNEVIFAGITEIVLKICFSVNVIVAVIDIYIKLIKINRRWLGNLQGIHYSTDGCHFRRERLTFLLLGQIQTYFFVVVVETVKLAQCQCDL